jgi:hypothetical protein
MSCTRTLVDRDTSPAGFTVFEVQERARSVSAVGVRQATFEPWDHVAGQISDGHPFGPVDFGAVEGEWRAHLGQVPHNRIYRGACHLPRRWAPSREPVDGWRFYSAPILRALRVRRLTPGTRHGRRNRPVYPSGCRTSCAPAGSCHPQRTVHPKRGAAWQICPPDWSPARAACVHTLRQLAKFDRRLAYRVPN